MYKRLKKSGFTLIELLVVISIIALLIAILLPALSAARSNAMDVLCLTRGRQVIQAEELYVIDNKGRYTKGLMMSNKANYWSALLAPYLDRLQASIANFQRTSGSHASLNWFSTQDLNYGFAMFDARYILSCSRREPNRSREGNADIIKMDGMTMVMSHYLTSDDGYNALTNPDQYQGRKDKISRPSNTIVVGDSTETGGWWLGDMYPSHFGHNWWNIADTPGYRHGAPWPSTVHIDGAIYNEGVPGRYDRFDGSDRQRITKLWSQAMMSFADGHSAMLSQSETQFWDDSKGKSAWGLSNRPW